MEGHEQQIGLKPFFYWTTAGAALISIEPGWWFGNRKISQLLFRLY